MSVGEYLGGHLDSEDPVCQVFRHVAGQPLENTTATARFKGDDGRLQGWDVAQGQIDSAPEVPTTQVDGFFAPMLQQGVSRNARYQDEKLIVPLVPQGCRQEEATGRCRDSPEREPLYTFGVTTCIASSSWSSGFPIGSSVRWLCILHQGHP